jgi:hypothetical protein
VGEREQGEPTEVKKVDKSDVEKGGYSSSSRISTQLPAPPPAITRHVSVGDHGSSAERGNASRETTSVITQTNEPGRSSSGTSGHDDSSTK